MTTTEPRTDQNTSDAHRDGVGAAPTSSDDHGCSDAPSSAVVAGPNSALDQRDHDAQARDVEGGSTSPATKARSMPKLAASPGISSSDNGHDPSGIQDVGAIVAPSSAVDQLTLCTQHPLVGGGPPCPPAAIAPPMPIQGAPLVDKPLAVIAELLNDLEDLRKANVNRLEVMTRVGLDKDGENRGWGLPEDHPAVLSVRGMVEALQKVEDKANSDLQKTLKASPLGPWVVAQRGLGLKTIARLLASIGDPYWNDLHERPRTVYELYAYTGYRPGLKRVRGEKMNWSATAKMRMHNILEPIKKMISAPCHSVKGEKNEYLYAIHVEGECTCSPYRVLWDQARDKYKDSVHPEDCVRCGPAGKPALVGSVRSAAHQQAMADRVVKKEILKELWREAKRLHELPGDHGADGTQVQLVAGEPTSADHVKTDVHADGVSG